VPTLPNRARPPERPDTALADSRQPENLRAFRDRLAGGDYDALLGRGLRRTLRAAAADGGLEAEIGALRLALAKLLQEEHDPSRLAAGVSRVAGVAVQAARLRTSADADLDEIRAMLLRELETIETEFTRDAATRRSENP
jgi:hypothetical protein